MLNVLSSDSTGPGPHDKKQVLTNCINQLSSLPEVAAEPEQPKPDFPSNEFSIPETMQEIFDISNRNRKKNKERKKNKDDGIKDGGAEPLSVC